MGKCDAQGLQWPMLTQLDKTPVVASEHGLLQKRQLSALIRLFLCTYHQIREVAADQRQCTTLGPMFRKIMTLSLSHNANKTSSVSTCLMDSAAHT